MQTWSKKECTLHLADKIKSNEELIQSESIDTDKIKLQDDEIRHSLTRIIQDVFNIYDVGKQNMQSCNIDVILVNTLYLYVFSKDPKFVTINARLYAFQSFGWDKLLDCSVDNITKYCKAGFFPLHEKDRCRCFSCGLTLEDWSAKDDPMEIHTRLSDKCSYLQILHVLETNKNIADLRIGFNESIKCLQMIENVSKSCINIIQILNHPIDLIMMLLFRRYFRDRESLNHKKNLMQYLIEEAIENGSQFNTSDSLWVPNGLATLISNLAAKCKIDIKPIEDIKKAPPPTTTPRKVMATSSKANFVEENSDMPKSNNSEKNKMSTITPQQRFLVNPLICIYCKINQSDIVFLPCGHFLSCQKCASSSDIKQCPICTRNITDKFKVFIA